MAREGCVLICTFGFLFIFSIAAAGEIRYDGAGRRDPFVPVLGNSAKEANGGEIQVEGIVYDPKGGSYALINGQVYREGESLDDSQLVKIMPDRLILTQNSEEIIMWLHEETLSQEKQMETTPSNEKG